MCAYESESDGSENIEVQQRFTEASKRVMRKIKGFSSFVGVSCEGMEFEVLELIRKIDSRWEMQAKMEAMQRKGTPSINKRCELKKLKCSINYDYRGVRTRSGGGEGCGGVTVHPDLVL